MTKNPVFRRLLLTAVLLLLISATSIRTMRADSEPVFKVFGDKPVLNHGDSGSWNNIYTDPGAVMYHDGLFHMFYNGFNAWPASVQIGYATSPDGTTWTKQGDTPVLKTDQVSYAKVAALASSVIVEADGTWVMYFYTWNSGSNSAPGSIGRATAPKPSGPWTVDAKPVLEPGSKGTWDDLRVDAPSVVHTEKGYIMYYGGNDSRGNTMIGLATSTDGITWTKHKSDTPSTDPRFAESAPILSPGDTGAWDSSLVHQPRVEVTPDGWVMVYRSVVRGQPKTISLGYAISTDGLTWKRAKANPILVAGQEFGKRGFWYTAFAFHDGKYYLYVEAQPGTLPESAVYVAIHEGPLKVD